MNALRASVLKEARVLLRDREGLAILFLMPLVFVVIMSLALQDFFRPGSATRFSIAVLDDSDDTLGTSIATGLAGIDGLRVERIASAPRPTAAPSGQGSAMTSNTASDAGPAVSDATTPAARRIVEAVRHGTYQFAVIVPAGAGERLTAQIRARDPRHALRARSDAPAANDADDARIELDFVADPALRADQRALIKGALERVLLALEIERTVRQIVGPTSATASLRGVLGLRDLPTSDARTMPTSTQQNVPAYSLLAIFMLVVPLSTTFIKERDQGTLHRLRTMPVPAGTLIAGKLIPYFGINLLQMGFCLAIGRWLVPMLGGEALVLTGAMIGPIVLLSAAASLAAIGFALLIAMHARTPEQATAFGAAAVLLMAALGGVMVPKLFMPATLQQVALVSPMGWALEGFLEVFLRDAAVTNVLMPAGALALFAIACLGLALRRFGAMMQAA